MPPRHYLAVFLATLAPAVGCSPSRDTRVPAPRDTVLVSAAAVLSAPLRVVRDSFARRTGAIMTEEHGASLDLARRITELHRVPDVIALADQEVFNELLVPSATSWYARFAGDRMVVAYTPRSRYASEISAATWWRILLRDDVLVGRSDPQVAPAGYRTLLTYALAEQLYREPQLARRLTERSPSRLQRGNAAELAALLDAGELDYIVDYESLARTHHFNFVTLPPDIDLGDASRAAHYATVSVRVRRGADSVTRRGAPIVYGVSVPRDASHRDSGARYVAFLLGAEGRRMLRREHMAAFERAELVGDSVPDVVRSAAAETP